MYRLRKENAQDWQQKQLKDCREDKMIGMIGFVLGTVYASFLEWWVHKELFHEHGKRKDSIFAYHLRDHHKTAAQNDFIDSKRSYRESLGLLFLVILHLPVCLFSVDFYLATVVYAIAFYILHHYSHSNPDWARKYMPWHWKHHMQSPKKNWNVVLPIADKIMRTDR